MSSPTACGRCIARSWLLSRLAGHLEPVRGRIVELLALADRELAEAVGGDQRGSVLEELSRLDIERLRERSGAAGVGLICRCDVNYPQRLADLTNPPAVLHVAGGLERFLELARGEPIAVVGARRPSPYGIEVARALGRELGNAGMGIVSGMALGIDSAAHSGALAAGAGTVAVLPASPERPYPTGKRALYAEIRETGAAVSELPPGTRIRRWMFPARNRMIAALAAMTVVVEAGDRSGALLTAGFARGLGRPVGAVPGSVTSAMASGPNGLLAGGAYVVRGPQDILDALFGAGARAAPAENRPQLAGELRRLLAAIGEGNETSGALARAGLGTEDGLAALAALELAGYVRRQAGGRFTVVP
ncbi:MAG: DNA-protecting protein DprA [Solirubrobacterales bacterium]|nr:DNA-protecting protein DprA [Solirubrobacterales bacterium]